jgi:hypothetical protein
MDIKNPEYKQNEGIDTLKMTKEIKPCESLKKKKKRSLLWKIQQFFREYSWIVLISLFIITLIFGIWGFGIAFDAMGKPQGFDNLFYYTLQLFVLQSGMEVIVNNYFLEAARFLAAVFTFYTLFFILWILVEHMQKVILRLTRGHIVICGLGYLGPAIARRFIGSKRVVIIEKDPHNQDLKIWQDEGAIIFQGDATREEILRKAHIERASDIFIVTGNDEINVEILVKSTQIIDEMSEYQHSFFGDTCAWLARTHKKMSLALVRHGIRSKMYKHETRCHVHIVDRDLNDLLLQANLMIDSHNKPLKIDFFNLYQIAGCCMLKRHPPFTDVQPDQTPPHILVIGTGRMGESVIVKTAKKWRKSGVKNKQILVSCISIDAKKKEEFYHWKYPSLKDYCDLKAHDLDVTGFDFKKGVFIAPVIERGPVSRVYICIDNISVGITAALTLAQFPDFKNVRIVVRSTYCGSAVEIFRELKNRSRSSGFFSNIIPFPIVDDDCCMTYICNGLREMMARASHANYIEHKLKEGAIPDSAMKPWRDLTPDLRESTLEQVDHMYYKIHQANCKITNRKKWDEALFKFSEKQIEELAELEHKRWCTDRWEKGWVYSEKTDKPRRRSEWMVPYEKLPESMKEYDRDPVRRIPEYLEIVDLKVEPVE